MTEKDIKPIPNYIMKEIYKRDMKIYPWQENIVRFYAYLTVWKKELIKVTVAHFAHDLTVYHAGEIICKNCFPVVYPARAENVLVHDVRNEVGRQLPAIDQAFARFFYVLHQISKRMLYFHRRAERLKVVSPVSFEKVSVLMRRLHSVVFRTIIPRFGQLSDHAARRNIKYPVKMQSACFSAALPYADVFPALAVYEVLQSVPQRLTEAFFSVLFVRKGESAKIAPFPLQIYFFGQTDFSADCIRLFAFIVPLHVFFPLLLVGDSFLHSLPHIGFALLTRKFLTFLIGGFELLILLDLING